MKDLIAYTNPKGPLPGATGTKKGSLLIIGPAACMWDDIGRYDKHHQGDRMGINDASIYYADRMSILEPEFYYTVHLEHVVSLHPEWIPMFAHMQQWMGTKIGWAPPITHSNQPGTGVQEVWPLTRDGATSGLFGILIALMMGYEKIVLAGMPCDATSHFYDPPSLANDFYGREDAHAEFIRARDAVFNGRVKSLSGNTKLWLGEPQ